MAFVVLGWRLLPCLKAMQYRRCCCCLSVQFSLFHLFSWHCVFVAWLHTPIVCALQAKVYNEAIHNEQSVFHDSCPCCRTHFYPKSQGDNRHASPTQNMNRPHRQYVRCKPIKMAMRSYIRNTPAPTSHSIHRRACVCARFVVKWVYIENYCACAMAISTRHHNTHLHLHIPEWHQQGC